MRVVVNLVGHGRDRNSGAKAVGVRHGIERHGAAIGPSPDRHAVFIELRILREKLIERGKLIFQLDRAELVANRGLEFAVAARSPAIVNGKNREAFARQDFIERTRRSFQDHLRRRSAVNINDQRNLAAGRRLRGKQQTSIERRAILGFELHKLRSPQSILRDFIARLPYRRRMRHPPRTARSAATVVGPRKFVHSACHRRRTCRS